MDMARSAVVPLRRLSICPCGYAVLDDQITVGVKYRIQPDTKMEGFTYRCGHCGAAQTVACVMANSVLHPGDAPAWIPLDLFGERVN
jgi:hypothetical protein